MVAPKSTPTTGAITSGSSLVVNRPSNVAEGDILTAWIQGQGNGTPDATPPAGWTRVGVEYDGESGGRILSMFVKEATSSEPETYTFTVTARAIGVIAVWDGNEVERSEEHTSELQSRENLVCRLLLEKKKRDA